jgi:hypothetical protein
MVEVAAVRTSRVVVRETLLRLAAVLGLAIFALTLTHFLSRHPPSLLIILGFAVVLLGSLALAIFAYDAAVAVGVLLLAAVRFQPAPTDIVFGVLMVVAYATGRFSLRRLTAGPLLLAGTFLAFNLVSMLAVVDALRAVQFLGITIYVLIFALWLASSVTDSSIARRITKWYVIGAIVSALLSTLALLAPFPATTSSRGSARGGALQGSERLRPFLVPAALILLEEILTPRSVLVAALDEGALVPDPGAGRALLVLACSLAEPRRRLARHGARLQLPPRSGTQRGASVGPGTRRVCGARRGRVLHRLAVVPQAARTRPELRQRPVRGAVRKPEVGRSLSGRASARAVRDHAHIAAHSIYARALAEEGIPGLSRFWPSCWARWLGGTERDPRSRTRTGSARRRYSAPGAALLANGFFVDTLHWRHLWLLAALIWAGSAAGRSRLSASRFPLPRTTWPRTVESTCAS